MTTIVIRGIWEYKLGPPQSDPQGPYKGHKIGCCYEPICCGCTCGRWIYLGRADQCHAPKTDARHQDVLTAENVSNTTNHSTSIIESTMEEPDRLTADEFAQRLVGLILILMGLIWLALQLLGIWKY